MSNIYFESVKPCTTPSESYIDCFYMVIYGRWALATAPVSLHGAYFSFVSFAVSVGP